MALFYNVAIQLSKIVFMSDLRVDQGEELTIDTNKSFYYTSQDLMFFTQVTRYEQDTFVYHISVSLSRPVWSSAFLFLQESHESL